MDVEAAKRSLHHTFSPRKLPLLTSALDALVRLLQEQKVNAQAWLGAKSGAAWLDRAGSLHQLAAQGSLDLAAIERTLRAIGDPKLSLDDVIDRFLLPHLLCLAARPQVPLAPPWLVDALAAQIAVDAEDALLDAAVAVERLDDGPGCLTWPWLARQTVAARWLANRVGPEALWQALAGKVEWHAAIPADAVTEAEQMLQGRAPADEGAVQAEDDVLALMDAFHALTAVRIVQRDLPRTVQLIPHGGALVWDLARGHLRTLGGPLNVRETAAAGYLEPPLSELPIPRTLSHGLQRKNWREVHVQLQDVDACEEALDVLLDLALDPSTPQEIKGFGFRLVSGPH